MSSTTVILGCVTLALTALAAHAETANNEQAARRAFQEAMPVFEHPRCTNCHADADSPRQTDAQNVHMPPVNRGKFGRGSEALACTSCHLETNQPVGLPPGVKDWRMPPTVMPMTFFGRKASQLCRQLKDPDQNGNKTLAQLLGHVSKDEILLWAWNPGAGRTPVTLPHAEFVAKLDQWAKHGAACPD